MNSNAVKRKYQKCVDRMKSMKKKPEFHGSDLEKIAGKYHFIWSKCKPSRIIRAGKKRSRRTSGYHQQLSRQRLYRSEKSNCCIYQYLAGTYCCRKWFYGAYLTSDQPARTKKSAASGTDLFRICKRAESGRRHTGIL